LAFFAFFAVKNCPEPAPMGNVGAKKIPRDAEARAGNFH
jgi:hypothetical protein